MELYLEEQEEKERQREIVRLIDKRFLIFCSRRKIDTKSLHLCFHSFI